MQILPLTAKNRISSGTIAPRSLQSSTTASDTSNTTTSSTQDQSYLNIKQVTQSSSYDISESEKTDKDSLKKEAIKLIKALIMPLSVLFGFLVVLSFVIASKGRNLIGIVLEPFWLQNGAHDGIVNNYKKHLNSIFDMRFFAAYFNWGLQAMLQEFRGQTVDLLILRLRKRAERAELASRHVSSTLPRLLKLNRTNIAKLLYDRLSLIENKDPKYNPT
ncbi:MAG: hypothetical protein QNJ31_04480 [Candidatus Caenarcaniphilales bacterium]|nr:hypothetical protein [Candidatus Caenarcaniphilales bacterium]